MKTKERKSDRKIREAVPHIWWEGITQQLCAGQHEKLGDIVSDVVESRYGRANSSLSVG